MSVEIELSKIQPRYLCLDPASGKQDAKIKSVRARSAIVVVGSDIFGRIWVLDAWAGRVGTNTIVDNFVSMAIKWGPIICGYESVAQQDLLWDPLMNKATEKGVRLPLTPIKPPTGVDKKWRIRTILQPVIGAGRLIILDDLIELKNELTSFPMNARMDLVDVLAMAVSLIPPVASMGTGVDEKRELVRYLEESGMPLSEIEQYLGETGGVSIENGKWWNKLIKIQGLRARA